MPDEAARARIHREVEQITDAIEALTGLKSNWNGEFDFAPPDALYLGLKPFACGIQLRADYSERDERWRTLIHEAFHAVSAGYNAIAYDQWIGFEEAVVEQLQRLFRQRLLGQLKV